MDCEEVHHMLLGGQPPNPRDFGRHGLRCSRFLCLRKWCCNLTLARRNGVRLCGDTTWQGIVESTVRQGRWSVSGRSWGDLFVAPEDIVREQRVQDREQLAHAGDQGQLLGFASGEQVQVICAMCDVFTTGRETFEENYKRHLSSWDATLRSKLLANSFSTHTDYKLKAITDRLDEDNK